MAAPPVLHIVLGNLVHNAFNYTTSGRIILRLGHDSVSIEDTGIGIPPHDLPHIYERHYHGSLAPSAGTRVQLSFGATPPPLKLLFLFPDTRHAACAAAPEKK